MTEHNRLLHAHVDAVQRKPDEVIARDDRAVGAEPLRRHEAEAHVANVAPVLRGEARPRAVKVQTAHLDAERGAVDAVDDRAMPLIGGRQAGAAVDVRGDREGVLRARQRSVDDRILLRLRGAVAELMAFPATPRAVVINEALEIARKFSSPESVQFINGVLDSVSKELDKTKA